MARKARLEGALADPVPGSDAAALERIRDYFRATHPEAWEAIRLCATQHGIDEMAKLLD